MTDWRKTADRRKGDAAAESSCSMTHTDPMPDPMNDASALTDLGNGRRFAADHFKIARYCHPWGKWLLWDETRWRLDDTGRVTALAKRTVTGLYRWAEKQIRLLAHDEGPEAKKSFQGKKRSRLRAEVAKLPPAQVNDRSGEERARYPDSSRCP